MIHTSFRNRVHVDIYYSVAEYYDPSEDEFPSHISEPVIGELAGWSYDLGKSPCAIVGLGFEPGRALGCLDYLEVPSARLFVPRGPDTRFYESVLKMNRLLFSDINRDDVFEYDIMKPNETFRRLESLIFGLSKKHRVVIVPLGPKIFAAVAIELALTVCRDVCVWRTSSGPLVEHRDVKASGHVAVFSLFA